MKKKKQVYLKTAETESELGDRIVLYYYLKELSPDENDFSVTTYGIGIDMYTQLPEERTLKEQKFFEDVFCDKSDGIKMIDILCKGHVTPITLSDVIYDYISC